MSAERLSRWSLRLCGLSLGLLGLSVLVDRQVDELEVEPLPEPIDWEARAEAVAEREAARFVRALAQELRAGPPIPVHVHEEN